MTRRLGFWAAFVVLHAVLAWISLGLPGTGIGEYAVGLPLGDVTLVYRPWIDQALSGGPVVGITEPWVYPIAAILPMLAAMALGPELYGPAWLGLVTVLNAAGFAVLLGIRPSRRREIAACWWLGFTALLGPISLARIDAVTVPIAVVALLLLARHPFLSGLLLTVVTWMKVWPAAVLAALLVASRERGAVFLAGAGTSACVAFAVVVLGGGAELFGFVWQQTGRGLQIEAPVATPYLWLASVEAAGSSVYYDQQILTYQVTGPGADVAARVMTPLLALAVTGTVSAGILAVRRGATVTRLFPSLALALVVVFIVVNKVGSPQFQTWLIAPVVVGLLYRGRAFARPAGLALVLAALTQLVYPYFYGQLLATNPAMLLLLSVRNAGLILLLGWALADVWRAGAAQPSPRAASSLSTLPVSSPE